MPGVHYVIIGNGVAGTEAALALRRREADARITVISAEHDHFFSRPALMYVFCGQLDLAATEPYDRGLYERLRLERVRKRVSSLETASRRLCFEDGSHLDYDRLLLGVGSKPRPAPWPGADGPGVHYFVTLDDLKGLDEAARSGMRAVVIGGGLIGVEVAEILKQRGLSVSFVIRENWYFPLALDEAESNMVAGHLRRHGCDVRLGADVEEIQRDPPGAVRGVATTSGEIACDPRRLLDRGRAQHGVPGRERPVTLEGWRDRGRRVAPDQRSERLGSGRLCQRRLDRRLAATRAALVHGARSGAAGRGGDAR